MNSVGQVGQAAGKLAAQGTCATGSVPVTACSALGALSRTIRTVARPSGLRGVLLEAGWLAVHLVLYPWGAVAEQLSPGGPYTCYRTDDLPPARRDDLRRAHG